MLTEYEAAIVVKQSAVVGEPVQAPAVPAYNRIGAVLVVLSLFSAIGLLYAAFFTDRGQVSRAPHVAPAATVPAPLIHPVASGAPEAALFLRHPLRADAGLTDMAVLQTGTSAR
jgi:hypothetical protein